MTCPICGKNPSPEMRPFCSKRCADIDLGKWLGEGYRVAGGFDTDEDLGDFEGAEDAKGEDKLH